MLYLVRHAHSDFGPDEMRELSASGRADAERVADLLQQREVSLIVSSPYTRAVQTVRPLATRLGIDIQLEDDLRERQLCTGVVDDVHARLEVLWRDFDFAYPDGESSAGAQTRVRNAIERIAAHSGERNVVIASHGNALALYLRTVDSAVDFAFWSRMSMPDVYAVEDRLGAKVYRRIWVP